MVNAQAVAAGKPELQDKDTLLGNAPTGVTVTVYVAGVPAGTVALAGAKAILKSPTVALALAVALKLDPSTVTLPLFPRAPATVGVRTTVTVAVAPAFKVPIEHVRVEGLPVGVPQLPGEVDAETDVAFDCGTSEKVIPVVKSPLFVMVYLKLT